MFDINVGPDLCVGNGRDRSLHESMFRIGFNIMFDEDQ